MSNKPCGTLYSEALNSYCKSDDEKRVFMAGFIHGQCEKVYLGSCLAAMFRIVSDLQPLVMSIMMDISVRYQLVWKQINDEFWVCRSENAHMLDSKLIDQSDCAVTDRWAETHQYRAGLCGIPSHLRDDTYHTWPDFNAPCM